MIVEFKKLKEQHDFKQNVVMSFLIGYYKDMQESSGVNIPYFLRARDMYKEIIHNHKDLDKWYKKIIERN